VKAAGYLLAVAALASGCGEPSGLEWVGAKVTHQAERATEIELCGGQAEFADRLAIVTSQQWRGNTAEEPSPERFVVDLRLFEEGEGVGAARGGGFAWVSKQLAYVHEVGHLVTAEPDGGAAPVFSEGVAELIGPSGLLQSYWTPPHPESFVYLQRPEFSTAEYYPSAQLMSFLGRRDGLSAVRDAYQRAPSDASSEQIDAAFVTAFGDEIFDAFDDFQAEPQCPLLLWQCNDEVVPTMELPFLLDLEPARCADADVAGFTTSRSDDWYPEYLGVLRLAEPRMIRYRVDNAIVTRQECQEACTPMESAPPWTWQIVSEFLGEVEFTSHTRAGDHHLKIRPEDPQRPFSVEIVDIGPV